MKQIIFVTLLLLSFSSYSQLEPPGLIYSCEKKVNDVVRYDIYNSSGQKIIPQSVDWAYSNTWTWLFVRDSKTSLTTVYNYYGKQLGIDSIESSQSTYLNLNRVGLKRNGKWGFYDKQGKLQVPHLYDEISHFSNNKAAVKLGGDIFMIDTNGVKIESPYNPADQDYSFDDMDIAIGMGGDFSHPDFKKVSRSGKVGLLDVKSNKMIVPVKYDDLVGLKEQFKVITGGRNGKYGLVAFGGRIIIPLEYVSVFVLNDYF